MADDEVSQRSQKQSKILTAKQIWNAEAEAEAENDQIDARSVSHSENSNNQNCMSDDSNQNGAGKMQKCLYYLITKHGSHVILASLVAAIITYLVYRDIYMNQEIRRLENVFKSQQNQTPAVQQIKEQQIKLQEFLATLAHRLNQQAEILKFVINDVNDRLKTISKNFSEPKEYECYHWSPEDLNNIHWNYNIATEKAQCEYYPSNVFTKGKNEKFPGCNNCWCCTKVDGMFSPRS